MRRSNRFGTSGTVIEYALLFALGFLAATLTGLLVAPAIQKVYSTDPAAFEWVCTRVQGHGFGLPLLR